MAGQDWVQWHEAYEDPASSLSRRLAMVRQQIATVLDARPPGPIRVVSLCAGQGRDLLGALVDHPRRHDVVGRLVELDPHNAEVARTSAQQGGLAGIEVVTGDAADTGNYAGVVPADLVLACGIFGNVSDDDIRRTIAMLPGFCVTGGTVIWTRHREEPDLVPAICEWFEAAGFKPAWVADGSAGYGAGVHVYSGPTTELPLGKRMFTFQA
ncbi:class I SAM-dependent methyltransferase family protein [Phytohabitans houttuyneae]|jgi:hypothetical protein|uniref:Methyltransferase domain-containing protein n=1 Tax=Phytohabitans houttuyneae TaxID=1076126 RepID=A0A6V8K4K3_9ACTN|nr:class I SAM-dependent methyltransferase family protein [Phytohabitans houttuyneae]GFJ80113.1 hypothetical protein Phou_042930 [Phytohabitans houttuyneae]